MAAKDRHTLEAIRAKANKAKDNDPSKTYQIPPKKLFTPTDDIRPQVIVPENINRITAFIVFALTLIVYMLTQARTMSFWDSGEYATCISILGVPHPPGNPFYIVFGRAVVALFGGLFSHAVIAAFISGLTSAFAVMFTYLITVKLVSMMKVSKTEVIFGGVMAAFFTAFSFTFWMNAIEAEVYSGLVFFVNIIFWLALVWVEKSRDFSHQNLFLLIVYLFFLGFCVHQTALQIAPSVLFIVMYPIIMQSIKGSNFWIKSIAYAFMLIIGYTIFGSIGGKAGIDEFDKWAFSAIASAILFFELRDIVDKRVWLLAIGLVVIGLSSHFYLMIRAAERPFINEGHPSTLKMFSDFVLRKQYGNTSFFVRRASFFADQMGYHFLRYFGMQWFYTDAVAAFLKMPAQIVATIANLIIAILGTIGAFFQYKRNRHSFAYFLSVFIFTSVVMVFVMNLSDAEVRDRDYFFVVVYNMWAIWLGIGAMAVISRFRRKALRFGFMALLAILPVGNFMSQYKVHDRSQEFIALDYGLNFLNSLEENAIIFTNGDNDTFPLWYAQAVHDPHASEHIHPARNIFPTEESKAAIAMAMDFKNSTLKGIRKDVSVANLSLLNTPWYIKQLRDREGIIFNWSDDDIDRLSIFQGPMNVSFNASNNVPEMSFSLSYEQTPAWRKSENFYRIADYAVIQIIKENFGKRPIYFAVTCENYVGFDDYLSNEGMVSRVVHTKGSDQVDLDRTIQNVTKIYKYRSIGDDSVYKDSNMQRLVMNYGSGFVRAATKYADLKQFDKALPLIDNAKAFIDSELKLTDFYVRYYAGTNQWDKLDAFVQKEIYPHRDGWKIYFSFILAYLLDEYPQVAMTYIKKGMLQFSDNYYFAEFAVRYAVEYDKQNEVRALFDEVKRTLVYDLTEFYQKLDTMTADDL